MQRITNYRKQNEHLGEPLPKRSKSAKFDASTTRSHIYEKPTKRTAKENIMPWTKGAMMRPQKLIVGFTGGPLFNVSNMIDLAKRESAVETSNQTSLNSATAPSCPALPEEVDKDCEICQEKLELFCDVETVEWSFRNAIRMDDKIYHPLCYEDHKGTLLEIPALNANDDEHDNKTEGATTAANIDADDDVNVDVIVLPNQKPSVSGNDDDDKYVSESLPPTSEKANFDVHLDDKNTMQYEEHEDYCAADADSSKSDVEIQEQNITFIDLDTYVENDQPEDNEASKISSQNVKIMKKLKDVDGDEDDGFGDIGTMSRTDDRPPSSQSLEQVDATEYTDGSPAGTVVIAPTELNISIDGNTPAKPFAILYRKIKINLAKSSIAAKSNSSNSRQPTPPPKPSTSTPPQEETPSFELKPALQGAKLRTMNTVKCSVETSGLCSVM